MEGHPPPSQDSPRASPIEALEAPVEGLTDFELACREWQETSEAIPPAARFLKIRAKFCQRVCLLGLYPQIRRNL